MSSGTLALVSLGCTKNAVDLQVFAGAYLKAGWTLSPDPDRADVVIVNTCSFIASAREKLVMADAAALWKVKAKAMLGKTYRALVVAPGVARMASQAPDVDGVTYLASSRLISRVSSPPVGAFVDVKLVKAKGFDFTGEIQ